MTDLAGVLGDVRAGMIPAHIYNDSEIFALEKQRLFSRAWLFVAHMSEIPQSGIMWFGVCYRTRSSSRGILWVRLGRCSTCACIGGCRSVELRWVMPRISVARITAGPTVMTVA